jgi:hypothetical protein
VQFTTAVRNARLSAIATALGSGGTLKFYTGSSPGVSVSATGTLLSTVTAVVGGPPSGGTMAITATPDPSNAASGTPGYGRLATSGGTAIADCTAAVGSGEINFSGTISLGGTTTDSSFVITEGNA